MSLASPARRWPGWTPPQAGVPTESSSPPVTRDSEAAVTRGAAARGEVRPASRDGSRSLLAAAAADEGKQRGAAGRRMGEGEERQKCAARRAADLQLAQGERAQEQSDRAHDRPPLRHLQVLLGVHVVSHNQRAARPHTPRIARLRWERSGRTPG